MHRDAAQLEPTEPTADDSSIWSRPGGLREAFITAVPLMVSSLSWTIMNFIDRIFLMRYSHEAFAAALPAGMVSFTVTAFPLGVVMFAGTFVAQYQGAGRLKMVGPVVWQAVWLAMFCTPLAVAIVPLADLYFASMQHSDQMVALESEYFYALSYSGGALLLSGAMSAYFNGRGRTGTVMIVDMIGAVANIVLDYFWIFGYGGFPEWGIAGAGWATTMAMWIKTLIYFGLFLRRRESDECNTRGGWDFDRGILVRLLRYGSVSGLQMTLEVGAFSVFIGLVGRLGTEALAATNLAFNVNNFAFMPIWGVGIAASTMVGRRLGENRPDLAARSTWSALFWGLIYMGTICTFYVVRPEFVLLPFADPEQAGAFDQLRDLAIVLMRFVAAFGLIDAVSVILSGALKGAGDVYFVLVWSVGIAAVGVIATWIGLEAGLGIYWCWIVLTAWVAALCVAYLIRFLQGHWRSLRVIEPQVD